MKNLKYSQILEENRSLKEKVSSKQSYDIKILSNIITSQLNEVIEYSLRAEEINANCKSGEYDNILQDCEKLKTENLVVVFWEAANIIDGMQYKANLMNQNEIESVLEKVKSEINYVISNFKSTPLVIFNKFSSLIFTSRNIKPDIFEKICNELNYYLEKNIPNNVVLIDIDKILATISVSASVDFRFFYTSKALYTINFYKEYTEFIKPIILSVTGKTKKALIFDCDNTLWKGIVGEDGMDGIQMSSNSKNGVVFEEVQHLALALSKKGIIVGLCSKNNSSDVDNVLLNNIYMTLKNENIVIKEINWNDKVTNLRSISKRLNIGIDSLVFIDDSDFEVNLIRESLPQIRTLKVPEKLDEYPSMIREQMRLFYSKAESKEDMERVNMYKEQVSREEEMNVYSNIEDYIKSLNLKMLIYRDDKKHIARTAQLTQKTNQFNLTTKRYTESDIEQFINSSDYELTIFEVNDKFGSYGITGLLILHLNKETATASIDSLLMSCRVLGRNIELAFMSYILKRMKEKNVKFVAAEYGKTQKNEQVEFFYDKLGFNVIGQSKDQKSYQIELSNYTFTEIPYIQIND